MAVIDEDELLVTAIINRRLNFLMSDLPSRASNFLNTVGLSVSVEADEPSTLIIWDVIVGSLEK